MHLGNSVFKKNFLTNAILLVATVALLAGVFFALVNNYFATEKQEQLQTAGAVSNRMVRNYDENKITKFTLLEDLDILAKLYNVSITVVNEDGTVVFDAAADGQHRSEFGQSTSLDVRILETISRAGELYFTGTLGNFYRSRSVIFVSEVERTGDNPMFVFVAANMASIRSMFTKLVSALFFIAFGILLLAFLLNFWTTSRTVRPLLELRDVARCYARGDFSERVKVSGKDEVAELSDAFNKMADNLAATEKTRSEFIANVSHELKTPMTTITGFTDGMLDGTIPPERYREYLGSISAESKRLSRLVNTLLLTSRIDAGKQTINISRVNICDLIGRCALSLEQKIEEKKLDVDIRFCEEQVFVQADPDAIMQVLYNLIDNAQKYADEKGTLRISVERKNDKAEISVYNTGKGIPPEDIPHIFDRFYKVDKSRSLSKTSYGLGLYIVKSLINRHGEDISVRSIQGEFAEFSFCLKLDKQKVIAQPMQEIESELYDPKEDA